MLTLPTIIGLAWVLASFFCLLAIPFVVLVFMVKKKCKILEIVLVQTIIWAFIYVFIYFTFGGVWFIIGIIGPTLSIG